MKTGIELIEIERKRQIEDEEWTLQSDMEKYTNSNELELAALAYENNDKSQWPWSDEWWKPTPNHMVRQYVKSGALFKAEADRLNQIMISPYDIRSQSANLDYDRVINSVNRVAKKIDYLNNLIRIKP